MGLRPFLRKRRDKLYMRLNEFAGLVIHSGCKNRMPIVEANDERRNDYGKNMDFWLDINLSGKAISWRVEKLGV